MTKMIIPIYYYLGRSSRNSVWWNTQIVYINSQVIWLWSNSPSQGKMNPGASSCIGLYSAPHRRETAKNIILLLWGSFLRKEWQLPSLPLFPIMSLFNCPGSPTFQMTTCLTQTGLLWIDISGSAILPSTGMEQD